MGALASGGNQRRPGPPAEGFEEGCLEEVSSELAVGVGDGELPGEDSESPLSPEAPPGGAVEPSPPDPSEVDPSLALLGPEGPPPPPHPHPVFCDVCRVLWQARGAARASTWPGSGQPQPVFLQK